MILEEFDENKLAVINAFDIINPIDGFPKIAVSCFARATFNRLVTQQKDKIATLALELALCISSK